MKYWRQYRPLLWCIYLMLATSISKECLAQKQGEVLADSLRNTLTKIREDTLKVKVLYRLAYVYSNINTVEGMKYGRQGLELAQRLAWKKGLAWSYNNLGINYMVGGAYREALKYYDSAYTFFELLGNKADLAPVTCNIGINYQYLGEYVNALEYYEKALKLDIETGNRNGTAMVMGNIGWLYQQIGDYSNSLDYFFKALRIDEENGDKQNTAITTGNIGNVYRDLENYSKALEYYLKALKMHDSTGHKLGMATVTGDIGGTYQKLGDNRKALEYYSVALAIDSEIGSKEGVAAMLVAIGGLCLSAGKYSEAITYSEKGIKAANEIEDRADAAWASKNIGSVYLRLAMLPSDSLAAIAKSGLRNRTKVAVSFPGRKTELLQLAINFLEKAVNTAKVMGIKELTIAAYKDLVDAYKLRGDYRMAMECYENYAIVKDSLFNAENERKISRQEISYEFGKREDSIKLAAEQKEKAIKLQLKLQRTYTYTGIGGVIALLAISVMLVFYFSQRVKLQRLLATEKIRNKVAGDLHDDVGSSLSSIALMSELALKQPEQTGGYLNRIGLISQNVIEKMNDIVWAINPDNDNMGQILARMQDYASELLEKKNMSLNFSAQAGMELLKLDMEERKNFFLLFKEAIHNAFKYSEATKVAVDIRHADETISMNINDNGKGFDAAKEYAGNGLVNMRKRAAALNGKMAIKTAPGEGTTVSLTFKTTRTGS